MFEIEGREQREVATSKLDPLPYFLVGLRHFRSLHFDPRFLIHFEPRFRDC